MTIVHPEAPWGQPQEKRLAPKERTHPMRPLSRNNNTTTRLKRGPNPLSGVLILVLIFFFFLYFFSFCIFFVFFFGIIYFCIFFWYFLYFFKIFFFIIITIFYLFIVIFFYICAYMLSPWGQPQQTIKSPGYREVLILSLGS